MDVGNSHSHNDDDNDRHLAKLCEIYFPSSHHHHLHHHQKETYQAPAEQRQQLEDLYKMKAQQQQLILQQMYWRQMQQVNQIVQNPHQIMNSQPSTNTQRNKPEKTPEKKQTAYLVAAANLQAADEWAWRKYGQKPIKGCNYPRSYYKCSSSKGCKAKKQVEKILVDPDVYMVTYKGEHAHLNPVQPILFTGSVLASIFGDNNPLSDMAQPPLQPPPEIAPEAAMEVVEEDEKEEELLIPNLMMVDQDMLMSMEELKNYYKGFNDSGHDGFWSSGGSGFN